MSEIQLKVGNETENEVVSIFNKDKYWAYNFPKKASGQPVDIVAIKGGEKIRVWFVDAKHVNENKASFSFEDIQPNQITSLMYISNFAKINEKLGFVIKFERTKEFYFLPFDKYQELAEQGRKSVNLSELERFEEVLHAHDHF